MATLRFANRTGQAGVYYTGSPNYVDVDNSFAVEAGLVTFAAKASDDSWANNDTIGLLVKKDNSNYKVWIGKWVSASEYFQVVTEEETVGTISNEDEVIVTAVLTNKAMENAIFSPQIEVEAGTSRSLSASDRGKIICCTSGSTVTITATATLDTAFHCVIIREGSGSVSVARDSTDTINGGTTAVTLAGQYKSAYLYQRTEGAWVCIV
jgi:hypothetical protein